MATNYPGALDTDATVGGGSKPASSDALDYSTGQPTHAGLHQNVGDAIEQIQTKLGTGASSPAANKALVSNGTASEWGQITAAMIASGQSPTFTTVTATNVTATNLTGELQTAAQPHIESVGTLTGLTTSGTVGTSVVSVDDGSATNPSFTFTSDTGNGMYLSGTDELCFTTGGTNRVKVTSNGNVNIETAAASLVANSPLTGAGDDAEWALSYTVYYLRRNSSIAADKENVSTDLGTHLTADMIDSVVPKMWNRKIAPGYPEIGPIADDMDSVSPFLANHGTDAEGGQVLTGINKTAWMSLMTLALQDIRTRLAALEG